MEREIHVDAVGAPLADDLTSYSEIAARKIVEQGSAKLDRAFALASGDLVAIEMFAPDVLRKARGALATANTQKGGR